MGILERFRSKPDVRGRQTFGGVDQLSVNGITVWGDGEGWMSLGDTTPAQMWRTQPALRTVVSFLARNIAQLGLHVFVRVSETDRQRDRESPAALALQHPNSLQSTYDLVYAMVVDKCLYDRAYLAVTRDASTSSGWTLTRLPPAWVAPAPDGPFRIASYSVTAPGASEAVSFPTDSVWSLGAYHPTNPRAASPAIEALRGVLEEAINSSRYRSQVWERGGRVSSIIERPQGASWSAAARAAFRQDWNAKYTGAGTGAGGTPILEDGMKLVKVDFSASDQQWVEGAKLSFAQVASAFHVHPSMLGQSDGLSWSSVREFRKMLYGDTLGPLIAELEDRLNGFLLPMLGSPDGTYVEFNIAEKLQGSFEEQTIALQASIGAPYMSRNEGRARLNLPSIDGGDDLVTPLNVLIGGQASPRDSGSQNVGKGDVVPLNRRGRAALRAEQAKEA